MTSPDITLNNGVVLPSVGLGVFQTPPEETTSAVEAALRTGYRLIDTAAAYGNEAQVGEGIRNSGIAREEIFIETKLWISDYGTEASAHGFEKSAAKLGADAVDLLLLHQALPSAFDLTIEAYKAMEQLLADGKVRAIGVSNFMPEHLEKLLAATAVVPAVNQIEVHPYFQQKDLQAINAAHGILTQAWSPIGGVTTYTPGQTSVLQNATLQDIATQHGKSVAQVMLRWHLQLGRAVVPKSTKPARITENFDVADFELTADQLAAIDALDTGVRGGPEAEFINLTDHAFPIPEA